MIGIHVNELRSSCIPDVPAEVAAIPRFRIVILQKATVAVEERTKIFEVLVEADVESLDPTNNTRAAKLF